MANLVVDFDGTLTDVEKEAIPYLDTFKDGFCADEFCTERKISRADLEQVIARVKNEVLTDPTRGWINNGLVVAPATADAYVLNTTIFTQILDEQGMPADESGKLLFNLHTESYKHAGIAFRKDAAEFLNFATKYFDTTIVTNSKTDAVKAKLEKLCDYNVNIVGNAKKYVVDNNWQGIAASMQPEAFPRPVLLRRKNYYDVIQQLNLDSETFFIGDIFELDLALPQELGYGIIQLKTSGTPAYEETYMKANPNGFFANDLESAAEFLCEKFS